MTDIIYLPVDLTATYDENVPTPIAAPYNLRSQYDESGTPVKVINVNGFYSQDFGNLKLVFNQEIKVFTISDSIFGSTSVLNRNKWLNPSGFNMQGFGTQSIYNLTKYINLNNRGFVTQVFGAVNIWNFNKEIKATGFNTQIFGTAAKVYNLRQHVRAAAFTPSLYGHAYLQGGVKYIYSGGFNTVLYGKPSVINTKANQYVNLTGGSVVPPVVPSPDISPKFLRPIGFTLERYGSPTVYLKTRFLSLSGFNTQLIGTQWVSHSPRYLKVTLNETFVSGYPKIFDPTQRVAVTGVNTVIVGGVFGDIAIRNTRRFLQAQSWCSQQFGDWSTLENKDKWVDAGKINSQSFGLLTVWNKNQVLTLNGFYAAQGFEFVDVSFYVRYIKANGFYQPGFGSPVLTKTPELKLYGFSSGVFGTAWISHKNRTVFAGLGKDTQIFGEVTIWHYSRYLRTSGTAFGAYSNPRIEHYRRNLLCLGGNQLSYGMAWISHGLRSIAPSSINHYEIVKPYVGRHQNINVFGFNTTLFGTRIVPESQSVYPQGFINIFGLTVVDLWKKYIKPNGFLTTGQEGGHRFGTAKFWNLRQYIFQYYDVDSGLVPPKWTGWTSIENRNKTIGVIGSNLARVVEPYIENKARPLLPSGFDAHNFGKSMIADRVRYLRLQGMEAPYIGRWSIIYNATPVIAVKGFITDTSGVASILNTRRYFNRVGNFESLEIGKPMVANRIRTLKFEQRYTIAPIYMPLPKIDLHTRYIEEVGRFDDYQAFGSPALSIHWKIITPRWTLRDVYGYPTVKNVTPELGTRGRNSEEFGHAFLRTQWRELLHKGNETITWGRAVIAFRDRQFSINGVVSWNVPRPKVIKTGIPPYYPQYIWLDTIEIDGDLKGNYGIGIPVNQVPRVNVKSNVLFPTGFVASHYGNHYTQSNGILVQPGLQELTIGNPFVGLKDRMIIVPTLGDFMQIGWDNRPRISPHTVYAVMDSPNQARQNHPVGGRMHYVNSDGGNRAAGEVFGQISITHFHRRISAGLGFQGNTNSNHRIQLKKRYISLADFGIKSWRMGFHVVGPFDQWMEQFDSSNMQAFGRPSLSIPYGGAFYIRPNGIPSLIPNRPIVDFFNRSIKALGSNHLQMGSRKTSDTPFMWQGLRVGELIKGNYGGFNTQSFGQTWISLKVREVTVNGFDMFISEYDYTQFDKRMRITRKDLPKPVYYIQPVGIDDLNTGVPNIKPAVHYIHPDGNADQFRKGAF